MLPPPYLDSELTIFFYYGETALFLVKGPGKTKVTVPILKLAPNL